MTGKKRNCRKPGLSSNSVRHTRLKHTAQQRPEFPDKKTRKQLNLFIPENGGRYLPDDDQDNPFTTHKVNTQP